MRRSAHLSLFKGFMVNLHNALKTRKASLMNMSLVVSSRSGISASGSSSGSASLAADSEASLLCGRSETCRPAKCVTYME